MTGAAGQVARAIRPFLARDGIGLRLSDIRSPGVLAPNESFIEADLCDAAAVARAAEGCAGVVHLGGIAKDRDFERLVDVDIRGVTNVLEAAVRHAVPRVVLASSMHVLGFYRRDEPVATDSPPRPDSRYAVAKLFAEYAGALFATKHGVGVTCLRLGHVTASREEAEPGGWVAPEDVAALVRLGLEHPAIRCEVIHAVAPYAGDDSAHRNLAARLGFHFRHHGTTYAEATREVTRYFGFDLEAQGWRGGVFASRKGEPGE